MIDFIKIPAIYLMLGLFTYAVLRNSVLISLVVKGYQTKFFKKRKANSSKNLKKYIKMEVKTALKVLLFDSMIFTIIVKLGLFPVKESKLLHTVLTFITVFFWYELWFYSTHRLLHSKYFFRFHKTHHKTRVPTPVSAFSFSLVERLILISGTLGLNILMINQEWFTTLGIGLYFNYNIVMSIIGHSDLNIYPRNIRKYTFLSDPPEHSIHHSKVNTNYGLFLNLLDKIFFTYTPAISGDKNAKV